MGVQYKDFRTKKGIVAEGGDITVKSGYDLILQNTSNASTVTVDGQTGVLNVTAGGDLRINDISVLTTAQNYATTAETNSKAYTDTRETAITTAYQGYADQAEVDAKAYTDARETAITTAYQGYADQAEVDAKAYTDTRETAITSAYTSAIATAVATKDALSELSGTTDDVTEGITNQYFTTARARASVSATGDLAYNATTGVFSVTTYKSANFDTDFSGKTTTDLTEGTNQYFTNARARSAISVTDAGGDGSLSYNSVTGVITFTGPSAAEVRAHFSAGTGVTINAGQVSIGQAVATTDNVTFATVTTTGTVTVGAFTLPATDGTAGQLLTTNGTGVVSWSSPAASSFTITDGTTSDTFNTGETMTFTGTSDVTATVSNNTVTFANTSTLDTVTGRGATTANDIQVGNIRVNSGTITGPATITIDPDATGSTGTVVIQGDLQVTGTTTSVNSTVVEIADVNITLASGAATAAAADGAGLTVAGAGATLEYASATDTWEINKRLTDGINNYLKQGDDLVGELTLTSTDGVTLTAGTNQITVGLDSEITLGSTLKVGTSAATGTTHTFSFPTTSAGAKIIVAATSGLNRHITEILVTHDGTDAHVVEYGTVFTSAELFSVSAAISGGNVSVTATATASVDFTGSTQQLI